MSAHTSDTRASAPLRYACGHRGVPTDNLCGVCMYARCAYCGRDLTPTFILRATFARDEPMYQCAECMQLEAFDIGQSAS
jgi:hypothetical protein